MRILTILTGQEKLEQIKSKLERECFSVDATADLSRGRYLSRINDYDLIILEDGPGSPGHEFCQALRQSGKTVPLIIFLPETDTERLTSLLDSGADDCLVDPVSFAELLARMRAILRRPRSMTSEIITLSDMVMDVPRHLVRRADRDVYLTKKEFELLEYLLRNQGQVLSRGILLEHVWDSKGDIFSNTIETHILNLRKKLDRPNPQKLIHTIPGRGYKIDVKK